MTCPSLNVCVRLFAIVSPHSSNIRFSRPQIRISFLTIKTLKSKTSPKASLTSLIKSFIYMLTSLVRTNLMSNHSRNIVWRSANFLMYLGFFHGSRLSSPSLSLTLSSVVSHLLESWEYVLLSSSFDFFSYSFFILSSFFVRFKSKSKNGFFL